MIYCAQCKAPIPQLHTNKQEWGFCLGNSMRFCSYSCLQQKKNLIQAKKELTQKLKAEKKAQKEQERKADNMAEPIDQSKYVKLEPIEEKKAEATVAEEPVKVNQESRNILGNEVALVLEKEQVTYLQHLVEGRLMEIIPSGYDLNWLYDMVDLARKLRNKA